MDKSTIRNAATVILVRDPAENPRVLMGQRGAKAAFLPNKFVFPGGAVDDADQDIPFVKPLNPTCSERLAQDTDAQTAHALAAAAIRELWEESGLILGQTGPWPGQPPKDWHPFAQTGHRPLASPLHYVFRAITPPGRPRRFDARFFLADARFVAGDLDDFSTACDELSNLQWVPVHTARDLNLAFITEVALAEVASRLPAITPPPSVPFFKNTDEESLFLRLAGASPLDAI